MDTEDQQKQSGELLLSDIITEGLSGEISLIGFPYDIGGSRDKIPGGQENGPDCMRRFIPRTGPLINSEYKINIDKLSITDYGNIMIPEKYHQVLEEVQEKLQTKVSSVYNKQNIAFVLGGTKDCSFPALLSLINKFNKPYCISLAASYDLKRLYDGDKVSSMSSMTKILQHFKENVENKQFKMHYFGIQDHLISQEDQASIQKNNSVLLSTNLKQIRSFHHQSKSEQNCNSLIEPITQAGILFSQILKEQTDRQIHLSISLESISSCYAPGVARPSVIGGFTSEEIIEIMFAAGQSQNIVSVDISDYNPTKEDFRTGFLYANMIYYFALGMQQRLSNAKQQEQMQQQQ